MALLETLSPFVHTFRSDRGARDRGNRYRLSFRAHIPWRPDPSRIPGTLMSPLQPKLWVFRAGSEILGTNCCFHGALSRHVLPWVVIRRYRRPRVKGYSPREVFRSTQFMESALSHRARAVVQLRYLVLSYRTVGFPSVRFPNLSSSWQNRSTENPPG